MNEIKLNRLLNPDEVADWLDIEKSYLYRLISERKFPCVKLGHRKLRFRERDIIVWLNKRSQGSKIE